MKYCGELQLQIFDQQIGAYVDFAFIKIGSRETAREIAREIARGRPWRICKCDRPLKPVLKNHYHQYTYDGDYQGKS